MKLDPACGSLPCASAPDEVGLESGRPGPSPRLSARGAAAARPQVRPANVQNTYQPPDMFELTNLDRFGFSEALPDVCVCVPPPITR